MKLVYLLLSSAVCYACFPTRDLQAEMVYATLVKIEDVNRYPNMRQKAYFWKTDKMLSFVTYEKNSLDIPIGTQTRVLLQK